ncbi:MAG: hypothetical protein AB1611_18860, partial [bacterium]
FAFTVIPAGTARAYYSYGYGGLMGGLYGLYGGGLYGYSGLMGGLYGLYGGGLYGLGGLYGGGLYGLGGLRYGLAEQAGTWEGLWWVVYASANPMTLTIVQDPLIPTTLTGTVLLANNGIIPTLIDVTGQLLNNQVILTGTGLSVTATTVTVQIVGTLSSPTDMAGNYTITQSKTVLETGAFQLTLTVPVVI